MIKLCGHPYARRPAPAFDDHAGLPVEGKNQLRGLHAETGSHQTAPTAILMNPHERVAAGRNHNLALNSTEQVALRKSKALFTH